MGLHVSGSGYLVGPQVIQGLQFVAGFGSGWPGEWAQRAGSSCGAPWGIFDYGHFSRFKGLSGVGWCWVSARALKCRYGAFMGLYGVVILFTCVRCPHAKRKKPFLPLFCFACLLVLSACPLLCVVSSWKRQQKKNGPFVGRFSLGGGCWFLLPLIGFDVVL